MDFFSSDGHWGHSNIIRFCNRPYKDKYHMNEMLIKAHNEVVSPEDTWHCVGDFAFGGTKFHAEILGRLNGKKKILYMGNHDLHNKPEKLLTMGWDEVYNTYQDIEYKGIKFRICHYPFDPHDHTIKPRYQKLRPPREDCDWLIHGHVHNMFATRENMINVAIDVLEDSKPISFDYMLYMIKVIKGEEEDYKLLEYLYSFDIKEDNKEE